MAVVFKQKKGVFTGGRVIVYAVILVVAVLFIVFASRMIVDVGEKGQQVVLMGFKNKLDKDVQSIGFEMGSVKVESYNIPSTFNEVCFVDLEHVNLFWLENPLVEDSVSSGGNKNVFLIGKNSFESFYVEDLGVFYYPHHTCIYTRTGTFELETEGTGDGAAIKSLKRDFCEEADESQNGWMCYALDFQFCPDYQPDCGYKALCCEIYDLCCQV